MKSKPLIVILAALALSSCKEKHPENRNEPRSTDEKHKETRNELRPIEEKHQAIQNELLLIQRTTNDTTQPDYIRESAVIFEKILREENGIPFDDWITAHGDMLEENNATTISTYVSFLKALEKKLPDKLLPIQTYQAMKDKATRAEIIEFNVARIIYMISQSIKEIDLYGDAAADTEIEGVLQRFRDRYGSSETGTYILEFLNIVHGQGLNERSRGIKPWETPRRPPIYIPKRKLRQP